MNDRTDGRTSDRYIDSARHIMRTVSKNVAVKLCVEPAIVRRVVVGSDVTLPCHSAFSNPVSILHISRF